VTQILQPLHSDAVCCSAATAAAPWSVQPGRAAGALAGAARPDLQGLVRVEVQREARVREEEVQAAEVEQVVSADLLGERLDRARVLHRVQQVDLRAGTLMKCRP